MPRPGSGKALQQPIFFDDLGRLVAALADGTWPAQGIVPVGGPETVSHADLVRLAVDATRPGRKIIPVPLAPGRWMASMMQAIGLPPLLSRAQFDRIECDKTVVDPVQIPAALQPKHRLEFRLGLLAAEMGLIRRG